jgi:hypothetical protein
MQAAVHQGVRVEHEENNTEEENNGYVVFKFNGSAGR